MAKRKRVGLVYSYNEKWIAGTYYILNIIYALNTLDEDKKPSIFLLTDTKSTFKIVKRETQYSYLNFHKLNLNRKCNLFEKVLNKCFQIISGKKLITKKFKFPKLDFIYPNEINEYPYPIKKVNWIPDFQEDHLPHLFSENEIIRRKIYQKDVLINSDVVVFSSENARNDFERLYPEYKSKLFVLPFAVTHPDFSNIQIDVILKKFNLPKKFFITPNQFWVHKNHIVILKAIKILKAKGINIYVAFTGKDHDYRNQNYVNSLKSFIDKNDLNNNIIFLGFIDRREQLCLMNNALAIIQPSLFEGWSTVVEDTKALNKLLILSDIPVHREQIRYNVCFFNPHNERALALILESNLNDFHNLTERDYKHQIRSFALNFLKLVNSST